MFKSLSTSLIARGILAVIIGIVALAWPGVTVLALVMLFAIYAFIAAGLQAARAGRVRAGQTLKRLVSGPPLDASAIAVERMRKLVALPVLSADALSSVAYGPRRCWPS